ncbi:MAG TPA: flagellar basal-body rod protein FlgG [Cyanobacteria bacterium UBA8530]|nr:flagellar basal-body rod protein FlgG [Cyanobacteria bacterium UBA8530]
MMGALWTAASGMRAQQLNLDVTSNNLANVNTTGFKRARAEFQDLMYRTIRDSGAPQSGSVVPSSIQVGMGVGPGAVQRISSQGEFVQTENSTDLVIEGEGFFQVTRPDGTLAYTRDGSFRKDGNGQLMTGDGLLLSPNISIPATAKDVVIGADGTVSVNIGGTLSSVGQIQLARFSNSAGLNAVGHNLLTPTAASGDAVTGVPQAEGFGSILQGYTENSNVKVVEEMVNLIIAQRAYEANSKSIQSADEMLGQANTLKR